jgi:putative Ig domain-containing protein
MLFIAGCGDGGGGSYQKFLRENAGNQAPSIVGSPPDSVTEGKPYSFSPKASDADHDSLVYSIVNKPLWAQFEADTGRLSGTPAPADVGIYADIVISVSDGRASSSLPAFEIEVNQFGEASVTLTWLPPTQNLDGSALTDLHGYRIYLGETEHNLHRVIELRNPGLTAYMIENLNPATWYFAMTSFNRHGAESHRSAIIRKRVG